MYDVTKPFPYAGQILKLNSPSLEAEYHGTEIKIDDWWILINKTSWMESTGNILAIQYGLRAGFKALPFDNFVLIGEINGSKCLVHASELIIDTVPKVNPDREFLLSEICKSIVYKTTNLKDNLTETELAEHIKPIVKEYGNIECETAHICIAGLIDLIRRLQKEGFNDFILTDIKEALAIAENELMK